MHRRDVLRSALWGASALALGPITALAAEGDPLVLRLQALERRHGGRLGVSVLDTGSGKRLSHRGDERFLMCSTFKLLAVAAVLARVDQGAERLDRPVIYGADVLLNYAPVTQRHVGPPGLHVEALCEAAIALSDNTAANLLLTSLGGPAAVTAFVRRLGDPLTRLDRTEPQLNVGAPGDVRDTTTPDAMLDTMRALLVDGDALSDRSRVRLLGWLRACSTGAQKLRAGLPAGWTAGDKTGSGSQGESNDVAIVFPPQRKPLLVTAYYAGSSADADGRNAVLAEVGRIASLL
ncbi:class A beta-lactamase [Dyella sp.]|jgi:beta-lactamase class A|uniref:class A beta-lactamase n=1 Tax=Dyella sp. TaxID=1869338 RepID=UPI002D770F0A|nr:class A beta-lactamase [Dyella sp.]HET6432716.1 class A beta-lactamase [Dyella sp.]